MKLTPGDITRGCGSTNCERGADYVRKGNVLAVSVQDDTVSGEVAGSGREVYRQSIRLVAAPGGLAIRGSCTCPVSYNCKHVAAVLMIVQERLSEPAPRAAMPSRSEHWLQQAAAVQALVQAGSKQRTSTTPAQRLVFVLTPHPDDNSLRLHACKARLRKDGSIGGANRQDDTYRLLAAPPSWLDPDDEPLVRLFAALAAGERYPGEAPPAGPIATQLLERACAEGRLFLAGSSNDIKRGDLYPIVPGPRRQATLAWHAAGPVFGEDTGAVKLSWRADDGGAIDFVLPTEPVSYVDACEFGELVLPEEYAATPPAALIKLVAQAPQLEVHERAGVAARLAELGLNGMLPAPQVLPVQQRKGVPTPYLHLESEEDYGFGAQEWRDYALLFFDYDGLSTEDVHDPVLRRVVDGVVEVIERDLQAERAAAELLGELGFDPSDDSLFGDGADLLELDSPEDWIDFMRRDLPRLRAAGWQVEIGADFRFDAAEPDGWYAELDEEGEGAGAWFALELGILVGGRRHALLPVLLEMIRRAPRQFDAASLAARDDAEEMLVELPDATRVILPWGRIKPILSTLGELYFGERSGTALRLPVADAARLAQLEAAAQLQWMGGERLRELGRKLSQFDGIRPAPLPSGLQAALRPYQHAGLSWLQFLREYGFGGILADDMGLGKTVQTLAHILLEKEAGRLDAPALVVAPTSLMPNWQAEAARFAPGLRVLLLHGKERTALFDGIGEADLVLTTYALLGRDEEALRRHRYHLLILDEAQYIKNSRTKASQTARLLDARHRLCLTGTPVQNHLGELWSQFHFLMPGLLGEEKTFNAHFRKPIENGADHARRELLMRRLKPFMLRRTKDKVATELPPKTEIVLPVELGGAQRDLYETVRVAMDRKVRAEIDRKGAARSHIVILDALLKLRQVCCHPRLLDADSGAGSAKLDTLLELLDTLRSEGRKVLVFSQFTSMLALIEEQLRERGIGYALLTGDTLDRAAPVQAFQSGQVSVFLISLKAGGVGLNLTAADTVIHYDPWWNPASENQATDRAWRIGQEQPVFVYKLIARGTLEETIQELQRRKGELANAMLQEEGELAPAISADELQAIFSGAAAG
ncbi:DEAD/DEAH box helicase [Massilia sp.]|uniref:DEAD/DEAH box helicase n=1 Tax=Massilia sp. TaxID=1882437 RepID=UPI00289BFE17|nr:DEAD/DEAH box helicase [Massilia sp.]